MSFESTCGPFTSAAPASVRALFYSLSTYVRATAVDGYELIFSLGELDPGLNSNEVIVADTMDGKPLADQQGPFRIVVPYDKRGVRSVRMLQPLEVVKLRK